MIRRFGPAHDWVELTTEETCAISRIERALTIAPAGVIATRRELQRGLTLVGRLLLVWLSWRRWAVLLLPAGAIGMVIALPVSIAVAAAFTALWAVGFAVLLTELRVRTRQARRRRKGRPPCACS